jgi:hypothetical protein
MSELPKRPETPNLDKIYEALDLEWRNGNLVSTKSKTKPYRKMSYKEQARQP